MNARAASRSRGFTLIEMVITLCVFALLAAMVFSIFTATLESVSTLQDNQSREDRAQALNAWLKQQFLTLPANGIVASYRRENVPFDVSDLLWGTDDQLNALDLHLQSNGLYALRFATYEPGRAGLPVAPAASLNTFAAQVLDESGPLNWRTLVPDLAAADWRFRSGSDPEWHDAAPVTRQVLVQLTFQVSGSQPIVDDFWIPPLAPLPGSDLVTAPAVTANP